MQRNSSSTARVLNAINRNGDYTLQLQKILNVELNRPFRGHDAMDLVRAGADPTVKNDKGFTLLHRLAENNKNGEADAYIEELVKVYGVNINIQDGGGLPPLLLDNLTLATLKKLIVLGAVDQNGKALMPLLLRNNLSDADIIAAYYDIPFSWLIDFGQLIRNKHIGSGAWSEVYLAKYNKQDVAMKEIDREMHLTNFISEAEMMRKLTEANAANIVRFVGFGITPDAYLILMSYEQCSLSEYMGSSSPSWRMRENFVWGVVSGVTALHALDIIHCDLKCQNILLDDRQRVKICDFSNSIYTTYLTDEVRTTSTHCAPEAGTVYCSQKMDIFSLAILFWEIIDWSDVAKTVFAGLSNEIIRRYYQNGERLDIPLNTPPYLLSLTQRCWARDPQKRPAAAEIHAELQQIKRARGQV